MQKSSNYTFFITFYCFLFHSKKYWRRNYSEKAYLQTTFPTTPIPRILLKTKSCLKVASTRVSGSKEMGPSYKTHLGQRPSCQNSSLSELMPYQSRRWWISFWLLRFPVTVTVVSENSWKYYGDWKAARYLSHRLNRLKTCIKVSDKRENCRLDEI